MPNSDVKLIHVCIVFLLPPTTTSFVHFNYISDCQSSLKTNYSCALDPLQLYRKQ